MNNRLLTIALAASLAIGLSGCYEISGSVTLSGTSSEDASADVILAGVISEEVLPKLETLRTGEIDMDSIYARQARMMPVMDPLVYCCDNPEPTNGLWWGLNGRAWRWASLPVEGSPTQITTDGFGGLRIFSFNEQVHVNASMLLPRDSSGLAEGGSFQIRYPANWFPVRTNGAPSLDRASGDSALVWTGSPGERVDMFASFEVYKDEKSAPTVLLQKLVEDGSVAEPAESNQPQALQELGDVSEQLPEVEAPEGFEWVVDESGQVVLVEVDAQAGTLGTVFVGMAWGLLGAGVLSGLIVLVVMAFRPQRQIAEAPHA